MATTTEEEPAPSPSRLQGNDDDLHPPPTPIDTTHIARFEFSDQGTKILMVEWQPDSIEDDDTAVPNTASTASTPTDTPPETPKSPTDIPNIPVNSSKDSSGWEVSWPGKSTFLPARDSSIANNSKRRVYFLLPPDAPVPATVTISRPDTPSLTLKPLPAIFPEGFDVEAGSRGVLHTLWAKKRMSELEKEMHEEMRVNAEGVGLQMVVAERDWIANNFLGVTSAMQPFAPLISPRSPIGGRLGEKLKGLKLGTSEKDLIPSPTANTFTIDAPSRTLSPGGADIAVSSFAAMRNRGVDASNTMSLNAVATTGRAVPIKPDRDDDDLFVLPISPRSPDMKRSPFSAL